MYRSLQELIRRWVKNCFSVRIAYIYSFSPDPLKGVEAQRLRTYFTSICMTPSKDLDAYGLELVRGDLGKLKEDFERRKSAIVSSASAHSIALNQLFSIR